MTKPKFWNSVEVFTSSGEGGGEREKEEAGWLKTNKASATMTTSLPVAITSRSGAFLKIEERKFLRLVRPAIEDI